LERRNAPFARDQGVGLTVRQHTGNGGIAVAISGAGRLDKAAFRSVGRAAIEPP
jgi:hypothetical protein